MKKPYRTLFTKPAYSLVLPIHAILLLQSSMVILILFGALIIAGIVYMIKIYNNIVQKTNQIDNARGSIDAMLKKRHDLIPKMVESVKEYMGYEDATLKEIVELRNDAQSRNDLSKEQIASEDKISKDIEKIQVQAEDYPDLKASENFKQLQKSLNEVEEQLSAARRFFNSAVKQYNDSIQMFPHSIIANAMNLQPAEYFESTQEEKADVSIQGMFNESKAN